MRVAAPWHAEMSPTNAGRVILRAMRLRKSGQIDKMTIVRPLVDGDAGTDEAGKRGPERLEVEIWSPIRLKLRLSVGFAPVTRALAGRNG